MKTKDIESRRCIKAYSSDLATKIMLFLPKCPNILNPGKMQYVMQVQLSTFMQEVITHMINKSQVEINHLKYESPVIKTE